MQFLAILLMLVAGEAAALRPGDHSRSLEVDGGERGYLVHVPPQYDPAVAMPVVLAFHGGGANAENMVVFSGLNEKADQAGFIVVYPEGSGRLQRMLTFNAGNCCGHAAARSIDDVAFTRLVLDDLERIATIDRRRVFATGMSNGAMMCYRLASELSDRIAAIAPVAGPMGTKDCRPGRAVSVMHFHGDADEFAPFRGGRGRGPSGTDFYSVQHSIDTWVAANGCKPTPRTTLLPDRADDGTSVKEIRYDSGRDGAEVVLVAIEGGGHTWPGREPRLRALGTSTQDISANDMMWEFFRQHPMK
ncbi:MAG: alpha/beta hydrolase family esterase [Planctomycetaceae bacterium]